MSQIDFDSALDDCLRRIQAGEPIEPVPRRSSSAR